MPAATGPFYVNVNTTKDAFGEELNVPASSRTKVLILAVHAAPPQWTLFLASTAVGFRWLDAARCQFGDLA